MNIKCADGFFFHRWSYDYTCSRCGISFRTYSDVSLETQRVGRLEDARSASALLGRARPVDRPSIFSVSGPGVSVVDELSEEAREKASLDLPAFLRRQD